MGRLIYLTQNSLDGFIGDGDYSWSEPSDEVMAAINDSLADVGTYLYGRRTYETMAVWETDPAFAEPSPEQSAEDAKFVSTWQAADKVVFSSTLDRVPTRRTRLERRFDAQLVADMKAASPRDLTVGGPTLGAEAFRLGLVDVVNVFWHPVLLGGGIPVLSAGVRRGLTLRSERRFDNGVVQTVHDVTGGA